MLTELFPLERDIDVYCRLKMHLPAGYTIQAHPSKDYFSEWGFCYIVHHGGEAFREIEGDFRKIEPGLLVQWARQLMGEIQNG